MFVKTLLNWSNMVSEPFYLGRANAGVSLASNKIEGALKETGITPLSRDKWKSLCPQIC